MESIFLRTVDGLVEMNEQPYELEAELQRALADHPALLPGSQMNRHSPRRWLLVKREAAVPDSEDGGDRWSLDHLFIDQDAIPTLVEVKRSSDTRARRSVVGQLLDYAANAAKNWKVEVLIDWFEETCAEAGIAPDDRLIELLGDDSDPESFWADVAENLQQRRLRLLFVADAISPELQAIIEFLNEQMDRTEVLGVEVKQFVGEGVQTFVPRVIGLTTDARTAKRGTDKRSFDERLAEGSDELRTADRWWRDLAQRRGWQLKQTRARLNAKAGEVDVAFFDVWGSVVLDLESIREISPERADSLLDELSDRIGRRPGEKRPPILLNEVLSNRDWLADDYLPRYVNELHTALDGHPGRDE